MDKQFPETLSHEERRQGQKLYRRFLSVNGIAVPILMESVLILFAIRNGISDPQIALLASFINITMPFMLVGKRMTARRGLAASWGKAWLFRYIAISPILIAPAAARMHPSFGPILILLSMFGFSVFRAIGMMNTSPMVGEITDDKDRGTYISKAVLNFNFMYIVTMKNGYGLDDHVTLLYSLMLTAGGILCSFTNGSLADHTGPRPLLILYTAGFFFVSLYWAFAPDSFHPVQVGIVLLLSGFCKIGIIVGLGHYFLSLVDESDRVGIAMTEIIFVSFFSSLFCSSLSYTEQSALRNGK